MVENFKYKENLEQILENLSRIEKQIILFKYKTKHN